MDTKTPPTEATTPIEHALLALNVQGHVEKKNGLSYLSWAWAWAEALKADPAADFTVKTFSTPEGTERCWMDVNGTAIVWVMVTINGRVRECFLPVMDHRNKPIPNPDAFQINTALMRCMTKCLALFGLGLNIYAGEDLPMIDDGESKEVVKDKPKADEKLMANLKLFSDSLIEYLPTATTEKGLLSYWKANQTQIDQLKVSMPDTYEDIREKFAATRAKLKDGTNHEGESK